MQAPHCALCGRPLPEDDAWWAADGALLPCGHVAEESLVWVRRCEVCGGNGRVSHTLSSAEWRRFRRQRLLRRAFVVLLSLLFLLTVGLVIGRDLDFLCGGSWAGVLLLGTYLWHSS
ncbi:MAG: hypothetical protein KC425_13995 [Anaerolineales bacterium]|nr:hypothetical protein [Anaerolineales bacterium]